LANSWRLKLLSSCEVMSRPPGMDPHRKGPFPKSTPTRNKKLINWAYPKLKAPGKYDEISFDSKPYLSVNVVDGFQFAYQTAWDNSNEKENRVFQVAHLITMPSKEEPAVYSFVATYVDQYMDMNGRVTTEGQVTGKLETKEISLKNWPYVNRLATGTLQFGAEGQGAEQQGMVQASVGYSGTDCSCTLKHIFPMGILQFDYLQTLSNRFFAGFQASFRESQYIGTSFAAKYKSDRSSTTFILNPLHMTVECLHLRNMYSSPMFDLKIGSDFTIQPSQSTQSVQSTWGIAYALTKGPFVKQIPNPVVKGRIESSGKVSCSMEDMIASILKLTLSGELDHVEKKYKFGVSLETGL